MGQTELRTYPVTRDEVELDEPVRIYGQICTVLYNARCYVPAADLLDGDWPELSAADRDAAANELRAMGYDVRIGANGTVTVLDPEEFEVAS